MAASSFLRVFDPGSDSVVPGTLEDIVRQYLAHEAKRLKVGDLHRDTVARYVRVLTHLVAWCNPDAPGSPRLGKLPMADAKQSHFADYLLAHLDQWKSGATRRTVVGDTLACLNWAVDRDLIPCNPWRKPKDVNFTSQPRHEMKEHHYLGLLRQTGRRMRYKNQRVALRVRQGCFFLWHTGARPCEFRSLKWSEIAWADNVATQIVGKTTAKTGFERIIPLDKLVVAFLRYLERQRRPGQEFVFVNSKGKPWGRCEFNRRLVYYANRAGIPRNITTQSIRHGFCCHEIRGGEDIKKISEQMGHVDTRMVERVYGAATRRDTERLSKAADKRLDRRRQQQAEARSQKRRSPAREVPTKPPADTPLFDRLD